MLTNNLQNILACPVCKDKLKTSDDSQKLLCHKCRLLFPIREGIPIMLVDVADKIQKTDVVVLLP